MTDEIKSARVKQFLNDPVIANAFERIKLATIDEGWKDSAPAEKREDSWYMYRAIGLLEKELRSIAVDGDVSRWNRGLRGKQN